jgi:isopentenyl-diphosphate delta-isomerase
MGVSDTIPIGNPKEISDWKYIKIEILENELKTNSEKYTVWLKIIFDQLKKQSNLYD